MERIWAPWRLQYLQSAATAGECFLCVAGRLNGTTDAAGVVWEGAGAYALLNAYPYANGHVMVAPRSHEANLDQLDEAVAAEIMAGVRLMVRALRRVYSPQGFNVGANLGSAAGAGFGDHMHFHVVPRWSGDTNFMTVVAGTRVIPEDLAATALRLREAVAALNEEAP